MTPGVPPASAAMFSPYLKKGTLIATNRTSGHKDNALHKAANIYILAKKSIFCCVITVYLLN
jgi:hypothetical protein